MSDAKEQREKALAEIQRMNDEEQENLEALMENPRLPLRIKEALLEILARGAGRRLVLN